MNENLSVLRLFLASPGDLVAEREIVETLVEEHNRHWSGQLGVTLQLIRWERDVRPGMDEDAQAVVNRQVSDDYDVLIGLLWGRFGTPTRRFPSGTQEEFERAIARSKETGSPDIMVYFKNAPLRPSDIDPIQMAQVQDFKRSLDSRGVLSKSFDDERACESTLRADLASLMKQFARRRPDTAVGTFGVPTVKNVAPREMSDDLGYFDHLETYTARMSDMTAAMEVISAATLRIGEQMSATAEQMRQHANGDGSPAGTLRIIAKSATELSAYGVAVRAQVPAFSSSRDSALDALTKALSLYDDFGNVDGVQLSELESSLTRLRDSAAGSRESLYDMRMTIDGIPRLTADLNRAKKVVCSELDELLASIEKTVKTTGNIIESIQVMRGS